PGHGIPPLRSDSRPSFPRIPGARAWCRRGRDSAGLARTREPVPLGLPLGPALFACWEGEIGAKFSLLEGELDMPDDLPASLRDVLRDKRAESAGREIADSTPRTVFGRVGLPGKATAIVGM